MCGSAYSDRAVVWGGECGGPSIDVFDGVHVPQGEGAVSGTVSDIFRHLRHHSFEWADRRIVRREIAYIRLVYEKLTMFPYGQYIMDFSRGNIKFVRCQTVLSGLT